MSRLVLSAVLLSVGSVVASATSPASSPNPVTELRYRRHHVVVDGSLAEWKNQSLQVVLSDPELAAPEGNRVVVSLAWDLDALYAAFEISDAEVFAPPITAQPPELFCGDSVELYVDVDGNAGEVMDARDFQFLVACDGRAAVLHGDALLSSVGFLVPKRLDESAVFKHVVARTATGFTVELGIPWSTLGVEERVAGDVLGLDAAFNDWVQPAPRAAAGVDEAVKLGAVRRLFTQESGAAGDLAGLGARPDEPTSADGYWAWSWSGRRDFGYPATWASVRLTGGPSLLEGLDRRLGALRVPAATLAGAGLFTLLAGLVVRARERRRSRALLHRISELEVAAVAHPEAVEAAPLRHDAVSVPAGAGSLPVEPGQAPASSELSGKIDQVRRLVDQHEPVPGDLTTRAIACIYEQLDDGFTPSDLADRLHVSLRTLQRAVAASLGCSPSELIMAVRLREAYRMLKAEHRAVKDAALSAGFTSQPHFSRKFKHYFGINPSEVLAGKEPPGRRSGSRG